MSDTSTSKEVWRSLIRTAVELPTADDPKLFSEIGEDRLNIFYSGPELLIVKSKPIEVEVDNTLLVTHGKDTSNDADIEDNLDSNEDESTL